MAPAVKKTSKQTFAAFDAELNETVCNAYTNADLTLTLKLGFRQINPAAGAAAGAYHDYGDVTASLHVTSLNGMLIPEHVGKPISSKPPKNFGMESSG